MRRGLNSEEIILQLERNLSVAKVNFSIQGYIFKINRKVLVCVNAIFLFRMIFISRSCDARELVVGQERSNRYDIT